MRRICLLAVLITSLPACTDRTDDDYRADVVASIHDSIGADLDDLVASAYSLQAASPSRAWNETSDKMAIASMRLAWKRTRIAYEHIEGAIVSLFPGIDATLDGRYDESLAKLGPAGDQDLFDARGVTGMHAIERILFAPEIRSEVVDFERALPGYKPAAYPATDDEAIEFKTVLVQLLIDKALSLRKQWRPAVIDIGTAYRGLVGLMHEAKEKVNLATKGEEESRYANITLFDLRNNLEGTQKAYSLFRDWVHSKAAGAEYDSALQAKFEELGNLYSTVTSDALPAAPMDWSSDAPTPDNLATPFGTLWQSVHESVDPNSDGSVVFQMNHIATLLGFPEFVEP
ncbi:MAG TPA: imelysin family protein [Kofleriaceae bacterium]|nr:imelysin family protein [Kofleriaceae bacterium]